jgi:hypothetical protein
VGHNEDPIASVRGADGRRGYAIPNRTVPERGQAPDNLAHPSIKQRWDVFHDDEARQYQANDPRKLSPE